jgi:hypothetical protein
VPAFVNHHTLHRCCGSRNVLIERQSEQICCMLELVVTGSQCHSHSRWRNDRGYCSSHNAGVLWIHASNFLQSWKWNEGRAGASSRGPHDWHKSSEFDIDTHCQAFLPALESIKVFVESEVLEMVDLLSLSIRHSIYTAMAKRQKVRALFHLEFLKRLWNLLYDIWFFFKLQEYNLSAFIVRIVIRRQPKGHSDWHVLSQ